MSKESEPLKPLRTWSHLADRRRRPSEYEIVSTNLMYNAKNAESPFELGPNIPLSQWFKRYRHASPLRGCDWEAFRDPDEMTYRAYNVLQDQQETYVEGLLDQHNERHYDADLDPAWVDVLARLYSPARYVFHTVQMASHYLVQIVPSSTIRNCALYQAADAMRCVSHLAYRTAELKQTYPEAGFGSAERQRWENDEAWQGFRQLMEHVLVAYDWGESFVALNLVAKPALDEAVVRQLAETARAHADSLLGLIADSEYRDVQRSRTWTAALVRFAAHQPDNIAVMRGWIEKWLGPAEQAIEAYCRALPDSPRAADTAKGAVHTFVSGLEIGLS